MFQDCIRLALGAALAVALTGCASQVYQPRPQNTDTEQRLFDPVSMKLDTFSKVRDWTNSGAPDGVEALVEFEDRFGDRTKAAGTILFELFAYRPGWPDPRGDRLVNPWSASLATVEQQRTHWEPASGAYSFRLQCDGLAANRDYVLTATFDSVQGERFFSRIVLQAHPDEKPATAPSASGAALPGDGTTDVRP